MPASSSEHDIASTRRRLTVVGPVVAGGLVGVLALLFLWPRQCLTLLSAAGQPFTTCTALLQWPAYGSPTSAFAVLRGQAIAWAWGVGLGLLTYMAYRRLARRS